MFPSAVAASGPSPQMVTRRAKRVNAPSRVLLCPQRKTALPSCFTLSLLGFSRMTSMAYATRRPKTDLAALLSEQTPHIDLRLGDYERITRRFRERITKYAEDAIKAIGEGQDKFVADQKMCAEHAQKYEGQINDAKAKELELTTGARSYLAEQKC